MNDSDVIDAFVEHLRGNGYPDLHIEMRPDQTNRNSADIDAIAGPFAIEHTSIDTLPKQRRDSDWFMQAAGGIGKEISMKVSFRLRVTLDYDAVTRGQDWAAIRHALKKFIANEAPLLADGRYVLDGIPWVPFRLYVTKASDRPPGVFIGRVEPSGDTLPICVKKQFDRKAKKLEKYSPEKTTLLLAESDDFVLMNESMMLDTIRKAYPAVPPPGVDQIWYADTSLPSEIKFRRFF